MRWCGFATYRWLVKNCILIGNTVSCIRGSAIFFNRSIEHHVVKTGIEFEHLPGLCQGWWQHRQNKTY